MGLKDPNLHRLKAREDWSNNFRRYDRMMRQAANKELILLKVPEGSSVAISASCQRWPTD